MMPQFLRYTPHYRQKLASEGREQRLLKNQEELASKWHKADDIKETERRVFKNLIRKVRANRDDAMCQLFSRVLRRRQVKAGETPGTSSEHARLATCYACTAALGNSVEAADLSCDFFWFELILDQILIYFE